MDQHLYFKNLDASRFFAFILVFLAHCFVTTDAAMAETTLFQSVYNWGKVGMLGLEYFFVLSSFLISIIILEERSQTKAFHVGNFLIRRSLRVWPLYFFIVLLGVLVAGTAEYLDTPISPLPPWYNLTFFLVNFYIINHGSNFLFFIAFLWSISVEEQFYLLWSFCMKWINKRFTQFCWMLIIISVCFRWLYLESDASLYFHTISVLGNFGIGGLLAYAVFHKNNIYDFLSQLPRQVAGIFYIILLLSIIFYHPLMSVDIFRVFARLYFSGLFALFIADQTIGENRLFNCGRLPALNHLGKISYGLYCYHGVVITLFLQSLKHSTFHQPPWAVFFVFPVIIFLLTVLISHFSYRYFEAYFLGLKKKFYTFRI